MLLRLLKCFQTSYVAASGLVLEAVVDLSSKIISIVGATTCYCFVVLGGFFALFISTCNFVLNIQIFIFKYSVIELNN